MIYKLFQICFGTLLAYIAIHLLITWVTILIEKFSKPAGKKLDLLYDRTMKRIAPIATFAGIAAGILFIIILLSEISIKGGSE